MFWFAVDGDFGCGGFYVDDELAGLLFFECLVDGGGFAFGDGDGEASFGAVAFFDEAEVVFAGFEACCECG